jgi:hypothetical protein
MNNGNERIMEEVERTYGQQRRDISPAVNSSNQ